MSKKEKTVILHLSKDDFNELYRKTCIDEVTREIYEVTIRNPELINWLMK